MQHKLGAFTGEKTIKGHYWNEPDKKCELPYSELGGHCFANVTTTDGRFWLEIHTRGSVTSVIVQDLQDFLDYALSEHCVLFVIWWDDSTEECPRDSERIVEKDTAGKLEVLKTGLLP
jgi:hypothetical protein